MKICPSILFVNLEFY